MDKCPVPPDRNHHSHGDTDSKQESSENGFHMKIYRRKLPEKPVPQSNPVGQDTEQFLPPTSSSTQELVGKYLVLN